MVPVTLPAAEVNPSLQRSVVEGAWTSVSHAVGSSLPELVDTAVRTNAGYIYDVFGIRKDQWELLSDEDRAAIEDAAARATERLMDVQIGGRPGRILGRCRRCRFEHCGSGSSRVAGELR